MMVKIRNWRDFSEVNTMGRELYGDGEGLHGTPSKVSITQQAMHTVAREDASSPELLSLDDLGEAAGDYHGPDTWHRGVFAEIQEFSAFVSE
jgi:creatinine amidohydrolase